MIMTNQKQHGNVIIDDYDKPKAREWRPCQRKAPTTSQQYIPKYFNVFQSIPMYSKD